MESNYKNSLIPIAIVHTMKIILFITVFGLLTLPGRAQVIVAPMSSSIDYKTLYQIYPLAVGSRDRATSRDLAFQKLSEDYWNDFKRFLKKRGFRPDSVFYMQTEVFFRADGRAERLHYQYVIKNNRPSAKTEQPFLALLAEYLTSRPLPVSSSLVWAPFRLGSGLSIAPPSVRTTPRGTGVLGDLTTAARTTRPDTVKTVSLAGLELERVPDVLQRFVNAGEINLGNNYLTSLPAWLTALPKLQRLNLMSNRLQADSVFFTQNKVVTSINLQKNSLTRIPSSVRLNRRLESLWLGNNDLSELNLDALRRLRRLNDLNLYNTGLTHLPKIVRQLKHVKVLDLYYNNLTQLPRQLTRMKRLEQLALAHNKLTELSPSLARLRRLRTLFVHHNRLTHLPVEWAGLKNLTTLDLGYNSFTVAPGVLGSLPMLEELALNNNNLQEFPTVLLAIKSLKRVYLSSNPLFGHEAMASPYAAQIKQLEDRQTQVTY